MAALYSATQLLLKEGLEASFQRHAAAAALCRDGIQRIGLELFPAPEAISSPTVTAVKIPQGITWKELDSRLREHGMAVGGNYGPLAGKVFRLGHMGTQAQPELVKEALEILAKACS